MLFDHYIYHYLSEKKIIVQKKSENIKELDSHHLIPFLLKANLAAPLWEEFFFRGIILKVFLQNKIPTFKALFFSSFLFGILHGDPGQFLGGFIIGITIGVVYLITYSILNCILLHAFNNFIVSLYFTVQRKGKVFVKILECIINNHYIFLISILFMLVFYSLIMGGFSNVYPKKERQSSFVNFKNNSLKKMKSFSFID
jgi:membrane protease YdiL (CAAX protease family)